MEEVTFYHQTPGSFNRNTIVRNCWVSILHALLMRFVWRAGFIESVVAFSFMRPVHSTHLLSLSVVAMFGIDPHDQAEVMGSPPDLDKAVAALFSYVGTLTALRLLSIVASLVLMAISFAWRHIVLFVVALVSMAVFEGAAELLGGFLFFLAASVGAAVGPAVVTLPARIVAWATFVCGWFGRSVARSGILQRALGETPYPELPAFEYSPIDPAKQVRLLEIERAIPFSIPRARLITYNIDNLPPFEAVSLCKSVRPSAACPIILNDKKGLVDGQVDALLHRLGRMLRKRVVWIQPICADDADRQERASEPVHTSIMYREAFRVLVWMGEGRPVVAAAGLILGLVQVLWKASMGDAVAYFGRLCVGDRILFEDDMLDGFLEFLDHPWFEDVENFDRVMRSRQVTFLMGNTPIMAQTMSFVGGILGAWDRGTLLAVLAQTGKAIRSPPAGLDPLITLSVICRQPLRDPEIANAPR
ncbi:hypothetical protein GGTG_13105 [Gaeumannomyces tritici R3-111a-1]|uniref:Uncharacterized protein n=1 Tax=Gaeumannomyces tritici (strain R3-111a-1) TaxID=644352 RepID=J3PHX4_GAET3|nr:hypothetical protein GGTG_13105 [Gaeumannomyces tritici R3-111a-1]EJT69486.1 hypothetical protein GGTG_13105 [Gaeumannomyces tritici R3-111a-1]